MKRLFQGSMMPCLLGILFATVSLAGCQKSDLGMDALADDALTRGYEFDGGAISELIEFNKTGFNSDFEILSLKGSSLPYPKYRWEINTGSQWVDFKVSTEGLSNLYIDNGSLPCQRIIKFRRSVTSSSNPTPLYSNECTFVNYAFQEDLRWGTDTDANAVKLGPYNTDFTESLLFDTRGDYFRDLDYISYHGNDAFMQLELTESMLVEIITGATPMLVRLNVWSDEDMEYKYAGDSSRPIYGGGIDCVPFPTFDDPNPNSEIITLDLHPGIYLVQVQGGKATNGGTVNAPISISLRGTI